MYERIDTIIESIFCRVSQYISILLVQSIFSVSLYIQTYTQDIAYAISIHLNCALEILLLTYLLIYLLIFVENV